MVNNKMIKSGIYKITNAINNKNYIGSAKNINKRKYEHFYNLKRNKHHNKHLQNSWNKHGEENFIFEIIEFCNENELIIKEQLYIETLKPEYNMSPTAGSTLGYKHTEQTKKILSEKHKNKKLSNETKNKMSNSRKGILNPNYNKKTTDETKEKISKATKGKNRNCREKNPNSKITLEIAKEIRKKYIKNVYGYIKLSNEYSLSPTTIKEIIDRKIWNYE